MSGECPISENRTGKENAQREREREREREMCLACDDQMIQCSNSQGEHQNSDVFIPIATFGIVHTTFNCNKERGSCHSIHTKIDPSGSIFFGVITAFV
jgi:hypothetical protein